MQFTIIALFAATAGFAAATPLSNDKRPICTRATRNATYYDCANHGFRGYCSVNPCGKAWCPDFKPQTCEPCKAAPKHPECPGTAPYYVCHKNGFRGSCSVDPCALDWCPDYEPKTCKKPQPSDTKCSKCDKQPLTCNGTSKHYVCGTTGFRGSCSVDPCALSWCPDYKPKTCEKVQPKPTECDCLEPVIHRNRTLPYYVCTNNGFRGNCSVNPCAMEWCPDYVPRTCEKVKRPPPTPTPGNCPAPPTCSGAGVFYVCAKNGFRGNCSVDPCALSWCPDYKTKTCKVSEPVCSEKPKHGADKHWSDENKRWTDNNGVCPEGTGYYQVCGNGFRGCCKADACGQVSPVCPSSTDLTVGM